MIKEIEPKEIVTIESPSNIEFSTNAKSHKGIILSLLQRFRKDAKSGKTYTPYELTKIWEECLTKYDELKKKTDIVELELVGWKGKDLPEIYNGFDNDFILVEHRKDKESGIIENTAHKVSHENVNRLLKFIKTWKINESHNCYDFAKVLGEPSWDEVWRKRTEVYFPMYYFPIKCLEKLGIISYSGRGKIKRLK